MKTLILSISIFFSSLAFAAICHDNPNDLLEDSRFASIHPLIDSQEYVGNQGKTLAARKDHDSYFNWESKGRFFGRIYSATYEQYLTGYFSVCSEAGKFSIAMNNGYVLKLYFKSKRVTVYYKGLPFTFFPYRLRSHGTLRSKLRASSIGHLVRQPHPWTRN